jgi:hypothetical protein
MEWKLKWTATSSQRRANQLDILSRLPEPLHPPIDALANLSGLELVKLQSTVHTIEHPITSIGDQVI